AEAARLRASYGLRTPDALLFATAKAAGATAFLTNDRAFLRIKEGPEVLLLDHLLSQTQ
ncbi:MAG: PIN domain-containing protein, partial [Candidatus Bipolaricaulaceae bacterium]